MLSFLLEVFLLPLQFVNWVIVNAGFGWYVTIATAMLLLVAFGIVTIQSRRARERSSERNAQTGRAAIERYLASRPLAPGYGSQRSERDLVVRKEGGQVPITHGLIIAAPHIDHILGGEKIWEMRSKVAKIRGRIALIRKGAKTIDGVVELVDCEGPLSRDVLLTNQDKHLMSEQRIQEKPEYVFAWVLSNPLRLVSPIAAKNSSQQNWVALLPDVRLELQRALQEHR